LSVQAVTAEVGGSPDLSIEREVPRIRRARRHDVDDIVELISRAHAETYAPTAADGAQYLADSAMKADRHRRFWRTYVVAEIDGRIVGVVQTVLNAVNALYVDKDRRGQGIGALLLAAAEAALGAKGVGSASVRVAGDYPRVISFYERHGWQVAGPAEGQPSDQQWGLRLLEMRKPLGRRDGVRPEGTEGILKSVLAAGALAVIVLSLVLLHAIGGMTKEASVGVGAAVAVVVAQFVFGLRSPKYGVSRTLFLSAAGTGIYLAVLIAAVALGWLVLQSAGLQGQAERDRTMTSVLVLGALVVLMRRPARYAVARFWVRHI